MTVPSAMRPCVMAFLALLCASLIGTAPLSMNAAAPPRVQISVDLTAAEVHDYGYILGTEIPDLMHAVNSTFQSQLAGLGDMWGQWFSGLGDVGPGGWGAALGALNQAGLEWIQGLNHAGMNLVENMTPGAPSFCNLLFDLAHTGNAWLADLNSGIANLWDGMSSGFMNLVDAMNSGLMNLVDGLNQFWDIFAV